LISLLRRNPELDHVAIRHVNYGLLRSQQCRTQTQELPAPLF
jgi:hypothetical protein